MSFFSGKYKNWAIFLATFALFCVVIDHFTVNFLFAGSAPDNDHFAAVQGLRDLNRDDFPKAVILGSSMSREGIDQEYLESKFAGTAFYNLSISSGKPTDFFLMYRAISDKKSLRLVVIGLSPWQFEKKYTGTVCDDPGMSVFFDPVAISVIYDGKNIGPVCFAKRAAVSLWGYYKYLGFLRQSVDNQKMSFWKTDAEREIHSDWQQFKYSENKPESYFIEEVASSDKQWEYSGDNFVWDQSGNIQLRALAALVSDLKAEKIPYLVVDMPVNQWIEKLYGRGLVDDYKKAINEATGGRAAVADFSFAYPKSDFVDFDHLNQGGRAVFTQDLAKFIAQNYVF